MYIYIYNMIYVQGVNSLPDDVYHNIDIMPALGIPPVVSLADDAPASLGSIGDPMGG